MHRHAAGRLASGAGAEGGILQGVGVQLARDGGGGGLVVQIAARPLQGDADGAVDQASVQVRQPVIRRQPGRDGALARRRRAVDGDDER
jgi:hypothetical protein